MTRSFAVMLALALAALASATADSLLNTSAPLPQSSPYNIKPAERPKYDIRLHDTITIDISIRDTLEFTRKLDTKRDASFGARIKKFVTYFGKGKTQLPDLEYGSQNQLKSDGKQKSESNIKIEIPADVIEIMDGGDLVIDAARTVKVSEDTATVRIGGVVSPNYLEDMGNNRKKVMSNNIKDLYVITEAKGPLSDNQKRGFITAFLEKFRPI